MAHWFFSSFWFITKNFNVWKEILLKDLSYKNLDIHTIIFYVDFITAADQVWIWRSAIDFICGKLHFFVRCCTNPLSLWSSEGWCAGIWIHWWFGQASSLVRYWIVGSAPTPKWFEMCWPESKRNTKVSQIEIFSKVFWLFLTVHWSSVKDPMFCSFPLLLRNLRMTLAPLTP